MVIYSVTKKEQLQLRELSCLKRSTSYKQKYYFNILVVWICQLSPEFLKMFGIICTDL